MGRPRAYRVEGAVTLGAAREGKQAIQIEWVVKDPQGKRLGTVSQKNDIPEGSLDGAWGRTADQAAGAAVQGIVKLLPRPRRSIDLPPPPAATGGGLAFAPSVLLSTRLQAAVPLARTRHV